MAVFVVRKKSGDRLIYKGSRIQKWQMFSESDRRGVIGSFSDWKEIPMKKRDDGYFRTQVELDDGIYPYKFRVRTKSSNFELNQWVDVIDPDAADVDKAAFRRAKLGYLQFASLSNRLSLHEFPNQYIIIEYPYLLHR